MKNGAKIIHDPSSVAKELPLGSDLLQNVAETLSAEIINNNAVSFSSLHSSIELK
jgi:hypothetical protein